MDIFLTIYLMFKLISDKINHLGTYKFDKNLHDFNLDYNSEITEEISKRILSDT